MKKPNVWFAVFVWFGLVAHADPPRANVLFIAVDDLNNTVGFLKNYPGVKTPHLDALAERSIVFTNAHCAAPACAPSRASVMTGLQPSTTGVYTNKDDFRLNPITKDRITLPDSFQQAGYITKGGGKLYHAHTLVEEALQGHLDLEPWDEFFPSKRQQLPEEVEPTEEWPVNGHPTFYKGRFDWVALDIDETEMADAKTVAWAERQLSKSHEYPLFLAVGIYRPHIPFWTPKEYFDLHPLDKIQLPQVPGNDFDDIPEQGQKFARHHWQKWIEENDQWRQAIQGYLASVSFADALVGRLIRALDEGPMAKNTIVVMCSDHGYHLGHKQHWEKFALWEQATQVPLLFADTRKKSVFTPGRCDQPVSLIDIYPTLNRLCELPKVDGLDGVSLVPLLKNPHIETDRAVVTTHTFRNHAVRSKNWRYIRYADGSEELYDHRKDPGEFLNLATYPKSTKVIQRLRSFLPKHDEAPMTLLKP